MLHVLCRWGEDRLELVKPAFGVVVPLKSGGVLQLTDDGMKRGVPVMRRAEKAQSNGRFAAQPFFYRLGQTRLPNARLTGQQHDPAFALLGLLPTAHQQVEFFVAADQRRAGAGGVERLEAALDCARADYLPRPHRVGEAFERRGAEVAILEQ